MDAAVWSDLLGFFGPLWGEGVDRLATPEALWALAVVAPIAVWSRLRRRGRGAVRFSSSLLLDGVKPTWRQRLAWVPGVLRVSALVLLVFGLARPQEGRGEVRVTADAVAIVFVVDRSYSMSEAMPFGGERLSRIAVVKRVFREFVLGGSSGLEGRPNDLIGLVTFGAYAETAAPLVRNPGVLAELVDTIELIGPDGLWAGTAIGEGLALAVARLQRAEEQVEALADEGVNDDITIKSKVVVLLTDGEENRGSISALQAANLASEAGVTVHSIGIGSPRARFGFDPRTLAAIAERTGGIFRTAGDADALRAVSREIDALEKTEVESVRHTAYEERFAPFAAAGLGLLGLELVLVWSVLRVRP